MPTPACRDALSREISAPVHDTFTGICYRNPCAAESAGALDWEPGCALVAPVYINTEGYGGGGPSTWVTESWYRGGGSHRRGNRRPAIPTPGTSRRRTIDGGPQAHRPGGSINARRTIEGGPGKHQGTVGSGRTLVTQPGMTLSQAERPARNLVTQPGMTLSRSSGSYVAASAPLARPSGLMQKAGAYSAAPRTARPMMLPATPVRIASGAPKTAAVRGMKGLGQTVTLTASGTRAPATAVDSLRNLTRAISYLTVGVYAVALIPPVIVGLAVRNKTKSWGKGIAAGIATGAIERAAVGAYVERRRVA